MPQINWNLKIDNIDHEIKLFHGIISGKRELIIDGKQMLSESQFKDYGTEHEFKISDHNFKIKIESKFLSWNYSLVQID